MADLTPAQSAELRQDIERLQQELQELLVSTADSSRPVALDLPIGRLSRMDALQQQQLAIAGRDGLEQRLVLLRNAQRALEQGSYGVCRDCEEPVGFARLKARPETPFCRNCQEQREGRR